MILKASVRAGGAELARHLGSTDNESVHLVQIVALSAVDLPGAIQEMEAVGLASARSRKPLLHVSLSPPEAAGWTEAQWAAAWALYDREFDLAGQPFVEVEHEKQRRRHRHRVYLAIEVAAGRALRFQHLYRRQERVSRQIEIEGGLPLTQGKHNRAVQAAFKREGLHGHAAAMAPLCVGARPTAAATWPDTRQAQRTGVAPGAVVPALRDAWSQTTTGPAFVWALEAAGLRLAHGHTTPQIVDAGGGTHDLRRSLRQAGLPVRKKDLDSRLAGLVLGSVRDRITQEQTEAVPQEYGTARAAQALVRKTRLQALGARQRVEFRELIIRQRQTRQTLLRGSWKGRGLALNGARALLAGLQAQENLALRATHNATRVALRAAHPPCSLETWLAQHACLHASGEGRSPAIPHDLRGYTASVLRSRKTCRIAYRDAAGQTAFVDEGRRVVLLQHSEGVLRAALQLVAEKVGRAGIRITGSADFRARAARWAGVMGVRVRDPDLQAAWQEGQRVRGPRPQQPSEAMARPIAPRGGRPAPRP